MCFGVCTGWSAHPSQVFLNRVQSASLMCFRPFTRYHLHLLTSHLYLSQLHYIIITVYKKSSMSHKWIIGAWKCEGNCYINALSELPCRCNEWHFGGGQCRIWTWLRRDKWIFNMRNLFSQLRVRSPFYLNFYILFWSFEDVPSYALLSSPSPKVKYHTLSQLSEFPCFLFPRPWQPSIPPANTHFPKCCRIMYFFEHIYEHLDEKWEKKRVFLN